MLLSPSCPPRRSSSRRAALESSPAPWAFAAPPPPLLCAATARQLLAARAVCLETALVSLDFDASPAEPAALLPVGVVFSFSSLPLPWAEVSDAADDANGAHQVLESDGQLLLERLYAFSASTGRPVSLFPPPSGRGAPSALIAGFSMHRFGKDICPRVDTQRKLGALSPLRPGARLLDCCTGLGYTAAAACARGCAVTTVELDDSMQHLCEANPWSRVALGAALAQPGGMPAASPLPLAGSLTQLRGDVASLVGALPSASFDRILHDPPSFALAGQLYSAEFYAELARLLAPRGRLYHYIGDPSSAHGAKVAKGAIRRLLDAGFASACVDAPAHGIVASHEAFIRATRPEGAKQQRQPARARDGLRVRGAAAARLVRSSEDDE